MQGQRVGGPVKTDTEEERKGGQDGSEGGMERPQRQGDSRSRARRKKRDKEGGDRQTDTERPTHGMLETHTGREAQGLAARWRPTGRGDEG